MEPQTRFDLNTARENWQNELASQPNLTAEDRRELETHLADTMSGLRRQGLNEEEAFWLACRRVGPPQTIGEEFEKADPTRIWRERVFWMVLAYLCSYLWGSSVSWIFAATTMHNMPSATVFLVVNYLVHWAPLLLIAIFLANGKLKPHRGTWFDRFKQPRALALALGSWTVFNAILWLTLNSHLMSEYKNVRMTLWNFFNEIFAMVIVPATLIALLIWLNPGRVQRTRRVA